MGDSDWTLLCDSECAPLTGVMLGWFFDGGVDMLSIVVTGADAELSSVLGSSESMFSSFVTSLVGELIGGSSDGEAESIVVVRVKSFVPGDSELA